MRLKQLKLAGFKSFADSTTLKFPNPLTAIVGPNGCGKSNVIDAIRWVMGESSAKQLRGGAMSDVIFAGSTSRKQMSYASVELVFEQTEDVLSAQLKNEYNLYHELSVRRQVSREGKSDYFINGTRCRKRDIVNIFLGTGLGARSYAVIEQGMISRLVDAKPEDMRVYIEEAAGVSKYQAKRVETSRHLAHAQDNLARLEDVKTELEKQIKSLQRQANAAEKYKTLHDEKKSLEKTLLTAKYAAVFVKQLSLKAQLVSVEAEFTQKRDARLAVETEHVLVKKQLEAITTAYQEKQVGWQQAEKQAIDAGHQHLQGIQRLDSLRQEADGIEAQMRDLLSTQTEDKTILSDIETKLAGLLPELTDKEMDLSTAQSLLNSQDIDTLTTELNELNKRLQSLESSMHVADKQQEQLEKQRERNYGRQNQLKTERSQIVTDEFDEQIATGEKQLVALDDDITRLQAQLDTLNSQRAERQQAVDTQKAALNTQQQQVTRVETELKTLNRLQEQAKQQQQKAVAKQDVQKPLISELELTDVGKPFADIIEKLASDWLYAEVAKPTGSVQSARYVWGSGSSSTNSSVAGLTPLSELVFAPDISLWQSVWLATDIQAASDIDFSLIDKLPTGSSILTASGEWFGEGWLINLNVGKTSSTLSAQISQQARCDELAAELAGLQAALSTSDNALQDVMATLTDTDAQQKTLNRELAEKTQEKQQTQLNLSKLQSKQASIAHEQTRIDQQLKQLENELHEITQEQDLLFEDKGEAQGQLSRLTPKRSELTEKLETAKSQFAAKQEQVEGIKEEVHRLQLDKQHLDNQKNSITQALSRANSQVDNLQPRLTELKTQRENLHDQLPELEEAAIELKLAAEKLKTELDSSQSEFTAIQNQQNELSNQRDSLFSEEETSRDAFNKYELDYQLAQQQGEQLLEQVHAFGDAVVSTLNAFNQDTATAAMLSDSTLQLHTERLAELDASIGRIGGVNLAAAEDLVELKSRFERLNTQITDVEESVVKLTKAMQQIDMETRGLFLSTLQTVNANIKELFPKVFGGGHAELTLEDKQDWQSGVLLMAQPPGKKNSRLALLSGGEKALTALSMVFAIFKLNPAPFCVLDEVDAPLDDANIGRFCALVKELSKQVQFVFISHNKLAMEMANDMLGVTMPSAGVSKLVSVSLDEASEFNS